MGEIRNAADAFATRFASIVIRFRVLVLILAVAAAAAIASGATRLEFSSNYRAFFSKENPELRNFDEFQKIYVKSDNILFFITSKSGEDAFSRDGLAASAALTEGGWKLPYASRADSLNNFQNTYAVGDDLIVEDLIEDVDALSDDDLAAKRALALAEPLLRDQLLTADGRAIAVNVSINFPEQSLTEVPETVAAARALRDAVEAAHPDLDIGLSGSTMLNNAFGEAVQSDLSTLVPAMFAIILVAVAIAVRSVSMTAAVLMVIGLSSAAAMGAAGFAGVKLAGPSPSAPIVILTLGVADSIHVLMSMRAAMRRGLAKRDAIIDAVRTNFLAVTITSLTTVVGFLALNFSDSPPFRDLGNITAVGVFAAWILSLTLLPALAAMLPYRVPARSEDGDAGLSLMGRLGQVVSRHAIALFVVSAGAGIALTTLIPSIELSDQFRRYFDERIEFRRDTDKSLDLFGFYPVEFSLPAGEPGGVSDPDYLKTVEAFATWLRENENVTHVFAITDIMKRLNRNLNADDPAFYRLPEDRDLAAQYLLLYELSLPYGLDLNDRINIDKSATRVTATFHGDTPSREMRAFIRDVDAWFDANAPEYRGYATGPNVMFTFIAQRNVQSMVTGSVIAILAIAAIMMAALRSVPYGLLSMAPNAMPVLAAFGLWAVLVGEVGFSVAAIASLSLGIVVDDTTHFLTKYLRGRREKGLAAREAIVYAFDTVGAAIFATTVILLAGFMLLTFSAFKINLEMGLLTSLTIALALFFDLFMLPGLLVLFGRDRKSA